jgi:carboxyl-terminal processing protease
MTKRRLLQRLALLPLAALLCALVVACGGGPGDTSNNACPGWLRDAAGRPTPEPPASMGLEESMTRAYRLSRSNYIVSIDGHTGLREAWEAAQRTMRDVGIEVPEQDIKSDTDELFSSYSSVMLNLDSAIRGQRGEQRVIDSALEAFARAFKDGHTYFLRKARWDARQSGTIYSFGIYTKQDGDNFVVTDVLPGSVAVQAGVKPGDIVLSTQSMSSSDQNEHPGDAAREFRIRQRSGNEQPLELKLSPQPLSWLRYELLPGGIGYVHLYAYPSFTNCEGLVNIRAALDEAITELKRQGSKAWIFDMRDNGGGSAETAAYVATTLGFDGLLLSARTQFVGRADLEVLADSAIGSTHLVIMINENSASSSEIVSYALQESKQAYIVGTQSRGAVVSTRPYPLAGGALFVTSTFIDVGPSRKVIDKIGVTPDKRVELDLELLRREGRDSQLEAATAYLKQKLGR